MPKLFKSILVKRFLAHLLEIGTTFSITLILLNILLWFFGVAGIPNILSEQKGILISISNESLSYEGSIFNSLLYTILSFTIFYFVYTTFNFFFTFSSLYPHNNFEPGFAQKVFGFKKFDFINKKESHLKKSLRMVLRETLIFISVYGVFITLTISRVNVIFNFFSNLLVQDETFGNLLKISFNLFLIFVLPALILSVIYLKISKGKQLFWDYYSGITLK